MLYTSNKEYLNKLVFTVKSQGFWLCLAALQYILEHITDPYLFFKYPNKQLLILFHYFLYLDWVVIEHDNQWRYSFLQQNIVISFAKKSQCFNHYFSSTNRYQFSYYFFLIIQEVCQVNQQLCYFSLDLLRRRVVVVEFNYIWKHEFLQNEWGKVDVIHEEVVEKTQVVNNCLVFVLLMGVDDSRNYVKNIELEERIEINECFSVFSKGYQQSQREIK